jgi:predicted small lipoprotein YifL
MMYRIPLLLVLTISATITLAACGQKGDLYLPADDTQTILTNDDGR